MAFGGASSNDDISIKVFLDTVAASKEAQSFFQKFSEGVKKTSTESKNTQKAFDDAFSKIKDAAQRPIDSLKNFSTELLNCNKSAQTAKQGIAAFAEANSKLLIGTGIAIAGIGALTIGLTKLVAVAGDGDKFGDVATAFENNAEAAGILADQLEGRLSAAFNDSLDKTQLLIQANKAFASGIDPGVFDELAFAAKKYADATGGDAIQALDALIIAVQKGNGKILEQVGTVQNGVLVLDEFTASAYAMAQSNRSVTDTVEALRARMENAYQAFAIAADNSYALKIAAEALYGGLALLKEGFYGILTVAIQVADAIALTVKKAIDSLVFSVVYVSEVLTDLKNGSLPDFSRALAIASREFGVLEKQSGKAGKASVKLGKDLDGTGQSAAKAGKQIESIADKIEKLANETTTSIEKAFGFKTVLEKKIETEVAAAFAAFNGDNPALVSALDKINRDIIAKITDPEKAKEAAGTLLSTINTELDKAKTEKADVGKIFGFDTGFSQEIAGVIEQGLSQAFQIVAQSITSGVGRQDVAGIGAAIGGAIGSAFGPAGAAVGQLVGQLGGQLASELGKDTSGTKARKEADKYFADIFNADRLSVVVGGEIKRIEDLVFNQSGGGKNGLFGGIGAALGSGIPGGSEIGAALGSQFGRSKPDSFANGTFDDGLAAASASTQSFFNAVGQSFEQLLGVSEEISGQIAAVLFNNVGGSLENLQELVQATGRTFEEMGDALFQSFFNGNLSVQQLQESLVRLSQVFEIGIPDKIGAIDDAARRFQIALADDKGSRTLFNSLRSIGAEAQEVGKGLGDVALSLAQALGLGANNIAAFLEAMKLAGINSIEELVKAGNEKLTALAANAKQISSGETPTNAAVVVPTNAITSTTNFTPVRTTSFGGGRSGGGSTNKAADEAKRKLEQLRQETLRVVTASSKYKDILAALEAGQIRSAKAGDQIKALYQQQFKAIENLQKAQENYDKALAKGVGGKKLADLVQKLEAAQKAADKLGESTKVTKLDFSGITAAIRSLDQLGVVAANAGITTETTSNILNTAFLRGKISITQYNDLLAKTNDLLGKGIPGAVGAFNDAFGNIAKAGRDGGTFLTDAIGDVAAEFEEFFGKNGSAKRKEQLKTLTDSFDTARNALQKGIDAGASIEEVDKLTRKFDGAKKALNDFRETSPKPELEDLRSELQKTFTPGQVDIYFDALRENGINSFEDLKGASNELLIGVAGSLEKLGFNFGETDKSIKDLINTTNEAVTKAAGGKDPLDAALKSVQDLTTASKDLPSIYTDFGKSLDGPMKTLQDGFAGVLSTLGQLTEKPFNTEVILNVRALYDGQAENLVELMFGPGNGVIPAQDGPGTKGLTDRQRERRLYLQGLVNRGQKLSPAQVKQLNQLNRLAR